MGHVSASFTQAGYRWRNDDGNEATATYAAALNTPATLETAAVARCRIHLDETAGGAENNVSTQWQYQHEGGGWVNVTISSSVVRAVTSTQGSLDATATTQQISAGTFVSAEVTEDGLSDAVRPSFSGNEDTELELVFEIVDADVSDTDTVELRVVRADGTLFTTYSQTPSLTVSKAAGANEGSASGSVSWAGSADGAATHEGSASGAIAWSGSADGATTHEGSGAGAIAWSGSATGEAPTVGVAEGTASGSISWVGSADGEAVHEGSGSGGVAWAGSATGEATHEGSSTGSITWAGSATGEAPAEGQNSGSASGSITWSGSATGETVHEGSGTGSISWVGSAAGEAPSVGAAEGTASGSITWAGTADGESAYQGSASGGIAWSGSADGATTHSGTASGSIAWVGTVGPPPTGRKRLEGYGLAIAGREASRRSPVFGDSGFLEGSKV